MPLPRDKRRAAQAVRLYRAGRTQREVATALGVSKQRAQQILSREGARRYDGGKQVALVHQQAARDAAFLAQWGMSRADYNRVPPAARFKFASAKHKQSGWRLTLAEWLTAWDGRWAEPGLALARVDHHGLFTPDNVRVMTRSALSTQAQLERWKKWKAQRK